MDENKPVELIDSELNGVAGGGGSYVWDKTYHKGDTMSDYCFDCGRPTTWECTTPTSKKSIGLKGWVISTTWVCTVCGKGDTYTMTKPRKF